MKIWMAALVSSLLAGPVCAADEATPGFSGQGEGGWEMLCHAGAGVDDQVVILKPERSAYANPKMTRASCSYKASAKGDLVVSVVAASTCPFKGASESACAVTVPKGRAGSFAFKVKR